MAYVSAGTVKAYLGISGTVDDALLGYLADNATGIVEAYTHRSFSGTAQTTRRFDVHTDVFGRVLWLDCDLCSIGTITNGDGATLGTADYVTEPRNDTPYNRITLRADSTAAWTWTSTPENAIAVTGVWHYASTPPPDILQATLRLTAWLYAQKDNHADQDRAFIVGNTTVLPTSMPTDVVVLLDPYRRRGPV